MGKDLLEVVWSFVDHLSLESNYLFGNIKRNIFGWWDRLPKLKKFYLTLALKLDWSMRICCASPLYIKATSLSSNFLSLSPTLVPINFWASKIRASVLFKYSFKKSKYFLGSLRIFLCYTLACSVILWYSDLSKSNDLSTIWLYVLSPINWWVFGRYWISIPAAIDWALSSRSSNLTVDLIYLNSIGFSTSKPDSLIFSL